MTDKDYKEMGLEEVRSHDSHVTRWVATHMYTCCVQGPRMKLLSAIVGSRSQSTASGETPTQAEGVWPEENTQSSEQ